MPLARFVSQTHKTQRPRHKLLREGKFKRGEIYSNIQLQHIIIRI